MTGKTFLIINELKQGRLPSQIAAEYGMTENAIYKLAKRNNIQLPERKVLSLEEKKLRKKEADAKRYIEHKLNRPDIALPSLPMTAAKFGAFSQLNGSWILKQGKQRSTEKENIRLSKKYGLKSMIGQ